MGRNHFFETLTIWRMKIAKFLMYSALWLIAASVVLIVWVLVEAWLKGYLPDIHSWGEYEGNHGPWGFTLFDPIAHQFRTGLEYSLMLLLFAVPVSFLSMLLKFNRYNVAVFAGSLIALWLSINYLYWLID